MSVPALRQPKVVKKAEQKKPPLLAAPEIKDFLIVTLKGGKKLVVYSDSYHGILTAGELYKCVFCEKDIILDVLCKEKHKASPNHRKTLENYSHLEDFKENLIRKISGPTYYCTICNVIVLSSFLHRHLSAENHKKELEKALIRAESYMPMHQTLQSNQEFPPLRKQK